jgi:hypothetical protein
MKFAIMMASAGLLAACASNPSPDMEPESGATVATAPEPAAPGQPIVTHEFVQGSNDFVRVDLKKGMTYRAELDQPRVRLTISPLGNGMPDPYVAPIVSGVSASGGSMYEIRPAADGVYQIRTVGPSRAQSATLTMYRVPARRKAPADSSGM